MGKQLVLALLCCSLASCAATNTPPRMKASGILTLPAGVTELSEPLVVPDGAADLVIQGHPSGSTLYAASNFTGRALLVVSSAENVTLRDFTMDGNRPYTEEPSGLPPSDVAFVDFYPKNGILVEDVTGLKVEGVTFRNMTNFPLLIARTAGVHIQCVEITDSGSRNSIGRNNTSGGILLEEGTSDFVVTESNFERILGNAVWTHSMYTSPRNADGVIYANTFRNIGRDAIQVGHATNVHILYNRGEKIGYPLWAVDVEGGGIPVGIDTAGNVDQGKYAGNEFREINGKCIDLDGFHHGRVTANVCVNEGSASEYPFGHFGIVMNNTNPDMQSEHIVIDHNEIRGMKFGGVFVIGSHNRVTDNVLEDLNTAGCNESAAEFGCAHFPGEPDLLQTGIYLGQRAERPALARDNLVEGNVITGHKMETRCIGLAPGVSRDSNAVGDNDCRDSVEAK